MVFAEMENQKEKQVRGRESVENQEFGFGQVTFESLVKILMEMPRRWLDIGTCSPVLSRLNVVNLTCAPSV